MSLCVRLHVVQTKVFELKGEKKNPTKHKSTSAESLACTPKCVVSGDLFHTGELYVFNRCLLIYAAPREANKMPRVIMLADKCHTSHHYSYWQPQIDCRSNWSMGLRHLNAQFEIQRLFFHTFFEFEKKKKKRKSTEKESGASISIIKTLLWICNKYSRMEWKNPTVITRVCIYPRVVLTPALSSWQ